MDLIEKKEQDEKLTACILAAVELESTFKLYSYRCMEPEVFIERCAEIIKASNDVLKKRPKNQEAKLEIV